MEDEFLKLMQRDVGYVAKYNEYTKDIQMKGKKKCMSLTSHHRMKKSED